MPLGSDEAERVLGSAKNLRVIRALASSMEPLTRYAVQKATGVGIREVSKALRLLCVHGWVTELDYRPKKYRLNRELEKVKECLRLLGDLEYL